MTTLVPITLFTFGLSRLPSGDATILLTFEPVVAFVLAAVILERVAEELHGCEGGA